MPVAWLGRRGLWWPCGFRFTRLGGNGLPTYNRNRNGRSAATSLTPAGTPLWSGTPLSMGVYPLDQGAPVILSMDTEEPEVSPGADPEV